MDPVLYFANIAIVASSWMAGIFVARYLMRKFFNINPDGDDGALGSSTEDLMGVDESEKGYIPVRIVKEENLYYGWFSNNDRFFGQSSTVEELRVLAYEFVIKDFGLRFEFTHEDKATVKPEKAA